MIRAIVLFKVPVGQLPSLAANDLMENFKVTNQEIIDKLREDNVLCCFMPSRETEPKMEILEFSKE